MICDVELTNYFGQNPKYPSTKFEVTNLSDIGVYAQDILIGSIKTDIQFSKTLGSNKRYLTSSSDEIRQIKIPFYTKEKYRETMHLTRDSLYGLLSNGIYYLREKRDGEYCSGKRYQVILKDIIIKEQYQKTLLGEIIFESAENPYAISLKTSRDIDEEGIVANDCWSYGMGLETVSDDELIYNVKNLKVNSTFDIYNLGNVSINPFEDILWLVVKNINYLDLNRDRYLIRIKNKSNNTALDFETNTPLTTIIINGVDLGGKRVTATEFLELSPGKNELEVTHLLGIDKFDIIFEFNFLYR